MNRKDDHKKDIHHIHDKSYKDLYSKSEIALDLFKNISNAKWVKKLKAEDLILVNNTYITSDYEEKEADIVYVEIKAIKKWIKNTVADPLAESAIKILEADKGDVEVMVARNAFILDDMKEKSKSEGKKEGIKEGIKQGLEQGLKEGIELTKKVFKLHAFGKTIK